ncbi:MAG TPA: RHS repeat-associated core domain-containing protein [Gemmatimonadaceae bacterium]|nr:RHS repeat-associated core domain-containing protein [Gemmatimonadaceae bacterium]
MSIFACLVRELRGRLAILSCFALALMLPIRALRSQVGYTPGTPKGVTATNVYSPNADGTRTATVTFLVTIPSASQYDLMYSLDCGPYKLLGHWAFTYYTFWVPPTCLFQGAREITGVGPSIFITVPITLPDSSLTSDITLSVWPRYDTTAVRKGTAHLSWTKPWPLNASFAGVKPVRITPPDGSVVDSVVTMYVDWCVPRGDGGSTRDVVFMGHHLDAWYYSYGPTLDCEDSGYSVYLEYMEPWRQVVTARMTNQSGVVVGYDSVALNYYPPVSELQPAVATTGLTRYVHAASPAAQEFKISNAGKWTATYQLAPNCGGMSGCGVDKSSVTLPAGATDSVSVRFMAPATALAKSTVAVTARFDSPTGESVSATATDTIRTPSPDGGNARSLFQPRVQPPDPATLTLPPSYLGTVWFPVTNLGTAPATYHLQFKLTGGISFVPWEMPDTVITVAPGQRVVPMVAPRGPAFEGQIGSVTMIATSSDTTWGTASDSAVAYMLAQTPQISFAVVPARSHNQVVWTGAGGKEVSFIITNTGNETADADATVSCSGFIANCRFDDWTQLTYGTFTLDPGSSANPLFTYDYVGGAATTGTMRVTVNAGTSSQATDSIVFRYDGKYAAVAVTPKLQVLPVRPWQNYVRQTFRITNVGTDTTAYTWSATCVGSGVYCVARSGTSPVLLPNQVFDTTLVYSTSMSGTAGSLRFTAAALSNTNATMTGVDSVVVAQGAAIAVQTAAVNPGASVSRGACLSIAAGDDAAYECGDLRIVHELPTTTTMNTPRTPTLVYQSAAASTQLTIAADVRVAPGTNPTSIRSTVVISNAATSLTVRRDTVVRTNWSDGQPRRIGVTFNAAAQSLPEGSYTYTYEVVALPDTTAKATDTGTLVVVDRHASPYGRGWWLDGLEHLSFNTADPTQRLWIGGDGSTRLFSPAGAGRWTVTPMLERPEVLTQTGDGGYLRWLRDSAHVRFDSRGRQIATINRRGDSTAFHYDATGLLDVVSLPAPPTGTRPVYRFAYGDLYAGKPVLTRVDAPPLGATPRSTVLQHVSLTNLVASITDPDTTVVRYAPDQSTGLITTRWNRLQDATTYQYDEASKLRSVTIDMSRTGGSNLVTTICAGESRAVASCPRAIEPGGLYTLVDGPRNDVGDTTRFYLDRFWAPDTVMDAGGHRTTITRDTVFALLPASLRRVNGFTSVATYNARGLVETIRDVAPYGGGDATTTYTWDPVWDELDQLVGPSGEQMRFNYGAHGNRSWQRDGRGDSTQATYRYNPANQLDSLIAPGAVHWSVYGYDELGNLRTVTTPLGITTTYVRDPIGRVKQMIGPSGPQAVTETMIYDLADRVRSDTTAAPAVTYYVGGLNGSAAASSLVVNSSYDAEGNLKSVDRIANPGPGVHVGYTYDAAHRKLSETDPAGRVQRWTYDPAGNVTLWTTKRGFAIQMSYDSLNRVIRRVTPGVSFPAEACSSACSVAGVVNPRTFRFPYFGTAVAGGFDSNLDLPADTALFAYDVSGNLLAADNLDARVHRAYYSNGALSADTAWIAAYDRVTLRNSFMHQSVLQYKYDLSGHRTLMSSSAPKFAMSQTYHYEPNTGLLDGMTDNGASINFVFDGASRLRSRTIVGTGGAQMSELRLYDDDDRLVERRETAPWGLVYDDVLTYDSRNKITNAQAGGVIINNATMAYDGMGALIASYRDRGSGWTDEYQVDALGNVTQHDENRQQDDWRRTAFVVSGEQVNGSTQSLPGNVGGAEPFIKTMERLAYEQDDGSGNVNATGTIAQAWRTGTYAPAVYDDVLTGSHWTRSYYGADEKLRVTQQSGFTGTNGAARTTFLEYRYDALGRRVLMRTQRDSSCNLFTTTDCLSTVDRFVWDGDQLLNETRASAPYYATSSGTEVDATLGSDLEGSVHYTHGGAIDDPLIVWKNGQSGLVGIVPHLSWRGGYEAGTYLGGGRTSFYWPAQDRDPYLASDVRATVPSVTVWVGSLMDGQVDASGLMYMRNRYYDPRVGKFTQADPIGLAGGRNLYGFANSDPVNFSDPLGLWPCPELCGTGGVGVLSGGGAAVRAISVGGPAGWIAIGGLALAGVLDYMAGPSGEPALSTRAAADASTVVLERRSGRSLKKEWEGLHGQPWPPGCVAHHDCPLADGGKDDATNIIPLTPDDHVDHHKSKGDFKRWGSRSKKDPEPKPEPPRDPQPDAQQ